MKFVKLKQNQSSTSIPWDLIADDSSQPTPPPQKRIKSAELYKKQHGLTDDQLVVRDHVSIQQHALRRERDKSKDSRERDRSLEMKESLLSQALEGGPTLTIPTQVTFLRHWQLYLTANLTNSYANSTRTCNRFKRRAPARIQTAATLWRPTWAMGNTTAWTAPWITRDRRTPLPTPS